MDEFTLTAEQEAEAARIKDPLKTQTTVESGAHRVLIYLLS